MKNLIAVLLGLAAFATTFAHPAKDGRQLVWREEFNGKRLDMSRWNFRRTMDGKICDYVNDMRTMSVEKGCLHLQVRPADRKESLCMLPEGVTTEHGMSWRYGYLEMRARIPFRKGAWPSFWMVSTPRYRKAKYTAEVDIFEGFASTNRIESNLHKWGNGRHSSLDGHQSNADRSFAFEDVVRLKDEFHVYGLEWTPKKMAFSVDGKVFFERSIEEFSDFDEKTVPGMAGFHDFMYVILNNEVFSPARDWCPPAFELTREDELPIDYWVDWIRLWQNPDAGELKQEHLGRKAEDGETCNVIDYPISTVDMRDVVIREGFWRSRIETNRLVTVKSDFAKCEESGRNDNFRKAARREHGTFKGCPFDDSDVYKVIEGAAYTLMTHPDKQLESYLDSLIADIAGAQEADGYLYTARTLGMDHVLSFPHGKMMGSERWGNTLSSHELYNLGHLIESAVAFFQATGKRSLLDVAIRVADMLDRTFGNGDNKIRKVAGHEEIELALCRLYRVTGEVRYLELAKLFLEFRGAGRTRDAAFTDAGIQNHLPVLEQDEAVGHAVRAGYLYSGMADVAAFSGDDRYRLAVERLWDDVVSSKLHLTGGIGSYHRKNLPRYGMVCEAFGARYDLPNQAYLETCAAIANALWNHRMFLLSGDGKYIDVLERILYNGFLSGVSLSGDEFFYPNPLESPGGYKRSKWFGCSCCPVNTVRFMPQIAKFAYATKGDAAYLNLFVSSDVRMALDSGNVILEQRTEYPWKGASAIRVKTSACGQRFALKVRIPGWAIGRPVPSDLYRQTIPSSIKDISVLLNGVPQTIEVENGYCTLERNWMSGDTVEIVLPMPVKRIKANDRVRADCGRLAVERGPIVFCAEGFDNDGAVLSKVIPATTSFSETTCSVLGNEVPVLTAQARAVRFVEGKAELGDPCTMKLIPYAVWDHREPGNEMQTWFPSVPEAVNTGCLSANVSVSHVNPSDSIAALSDGRIPANGSYDSECRRFTFWDHLGTDEWIIFTLPGEKAVKGIDVYWFDDEEVGGRCRVPKSWKAQVQLGEMTGWHDVEADYPVLKGSWSHVKFKKPHPAVQVRLVVRLREGFSAGAYEINMN